jgi:hypothetical protein
VMTTIEHLAIAEAALLGAIPQTTAIWVAIMEVRKAREQLAQGSESPSPLPLGQEPTIHQQQGPR